MTATRLTEAEKRELELESRWEKIDKSLREFQREQEARWRRTDAKLDEMERLIQGLRSAYEDRSMQTMDASSGSRESQLELSKFTVTPRQETEELDGGSDEKTPWNWTTMKVNGIDSEPCVVKKSGTKPKEFVVFDFSGYGKLMKSNEHDEQNQISFTLPARENAQLNKLIVIVPTPVYCYFTSKWLLDWDHKPKVKMNCMKAARANMLSNIALSRSIVTTSVRELEATVGLSVYKEGPTSHHLHSTSSMFAGDGSSHILKFWIFINCVGFEATFEWQFAISGCYEEESTDLVKGDKGSSGGVSVAFDEGGVELSKWGSLAGMGRMPRPLRYDYWEGNVVSSATPCSRCLGVEVDPVEQEEVAQFLLEKFK